MNKCKTCNQTAGLGREYCGTCQYDIDEKEDADQGIGWAANELMIILSDILKLPDTDRIFSAIDAYIDAKIRKVIK